MKVLDLQCGQQHVFEGWFVSEDDFLNQFDRGLIECPLCCSTSITKMLSAPRLNLGAIPVERSASQALVSSSIAAQSLQAAWLAVTRQMMANTEDVGDQFAEEARKIHYGETQERGIRGQASRAATESLLEEGISVMPLPIPDAFKQQLQ